MRSRFATWLALVLGAFVALPVVAMALLRLRAGPLLGVEPDTGPMAEMLALMHGWGLLWVSVVVVLVVLLLMTLARPGSPT